MDQSQSWGSLVEKLWGGRTLTEHSLAGGVSQSSHRTGGVLWNSCRVEGVFWNSDGAAGDSWSSGEAGNHTEQSRGSSYEHCELSQVGSFT